MRRCREIIAVCSVFILLLNDPKLISSCLPGFCASLPGLRFSSAGPAISPRKGGTDFKISYMLNGGTNSVRNPESVLWEDLPFVPDIPMREGYNFAGWYTDSGYTQKITEMNRENAKDTVLFAKWTRAIDSQYNVEMYSYRSGGVSDRNHKELKECSYGFLDEVAIPGMPSTREQDYLDHIISSVGQCLQGLCFTPEYILISAYAEESEVPGSLLVFDRRDGSYLTALLMREDSHLGGIAFDGENIWVCHSGTCTLERISYRDVLRAVEEGGEITDKSAEYRLKNTPSCITCYGGRIWVATHTKIFGSQMLSYSFDPEQDTLVSLGSYNIPSKVQGIAFDEAGSVYLSTSYGRNNSSYLKVYASLLMLTRRPNAPGVRVEMPPCSEEIAVAGNHVFVLFESASRKYFEGTDGRGTSSSPIDKVLKVDVASLW